MAQYIGLIDKDPSSDYGVSFPDFPGCITAGSTLDEARKMAVEALNFHIEGMLADGEAVPEPSSLEQIMSAPDNRDRVVILVEARKTPGRAVRVNISLPADVLEAIDRQAKERGLTRSAFIAQAARRLFDDAA